MRMKRVLVVFMVIGVLALLVPVDGVAAQSALEEACKQDPNATICKEGDNGDVAAVTKTVVNTLLFIVGLVSVIMIIVGGLRYTTSGGDSSAVSSAKNTILYAVIGLVVAFLAFAIVNFVVGLF